jgi:SH3 domain protein
MNMKKLLLSHTLILILALLFQVSAWSATTLYVSDELSIPLRTGGSNQYRILKFLQSGAALNVLETDEASGYSRVETADGKEGWVETAKLMQEKSARDRIIYINKKMEQIKASEGDLKKSIADLEGQRNDLKQQNADLNRKYRALEDELEKLKKTAAEPIMISRQNRTLEHELAQERATSQALEQENLELKDRDIKDWFMIGAGVSLGSLFFGLIIPNFKWRRKRDSWGDF